MSKTILISDEFHSYLVGHGQFGERFEDILIRLLGDKIKFLTGDVPTKVYSKNDVDSKKTKRSQKTGQGGKNENRQNNIQK